MPSQTSVSNHPGLMLIAQAAGVAYIMQQVHAQHHCAQNTHANSWSVGVSVAHQQRQILAQAACWADIPCHSFRNLLNPLFYQICNLPYQCMAHGHPITRPRPLYPSSPCSVNPATLPPRLSRTEGRRAAPTGMAALLLLPETVKSQKL